MDADEIIKPLQAMILMIAQRLGIPISAIEVQDLSRFICKYFKDFNIEEIPIAFDLLNARKFEIKSGGHFGILGQSYFGEVLNEYRKFRMEETRKENIKIGSLDDKQSRILTPKEEQEKNDEAMRKGVLHSFEHFKKFNTMEQEPSTDLVSIYHYDYLRFIGIIEQPEKKLREEIKEEAIEYLENDLKKRQQGASRSEFKSIKYQIKEVSKSDKLQTICKKIALRVFFESLLLEEKELIINN